MPIVAISGNVASGKSTLIEIVERHLGWPTAHETEITALYLPRLFRDPARWAFEAQIGFLANKAAILERHRCAAVPLAVDRSLYEDAEVFCRAFYECGAVTQEGYASYRRLYHMLLKALPVPTAIVFCRCRPATCARRVEDRGRDGDAFWSEAGIWHLDRLLSEWLERFSSCPVYELDTEAVDTRDNHAGVALAADLAIVAKDGPVSDLALLIPRQEGPGGLDGP